MNNLTTCLMDLIKKDDILGALQKIEGTKPSSFDLKCASKCLLELQLLVYKGLNESKVVSSSTSNIYKLVKKCLGTIESSDWEFDNLRFVTCLFHLINFFLKKDELSLAIDILSSLQRWNKCDKSLNDSENGILRHICNLFTNHLYTIDLEKFLKANSGSLSLLFVTWKTLHEFNKDEERLKNLMLTFARLIQKVELLKIKLDNFIHIESVECVISNHLQFGDPVEEISDTFEAYLNVLLTCSLHAANLKNYEELSRIEKLIDISKKLFTSEECNTCLFVYRNMISTALIDTGFVVGDLSNLLENTCNFLVKLFTSDFTYMSNMIKFVLMAVQRLPYDFKMHISSYPKFVSLILVVYKIEKSIIGNFSIENVKTASVADNLPKLIVLLSLVLSKTFHIPKESTEINHLLSSIFNSLQKVMNYVMELLECTYNNDYSFKGNCESLVRQFVSVSHVYVSVEMFDNALVLISNLIEKIVCLPHKSFCNISSKLNVSHLFSMLSYCSIKTDKVEVCVNAILAWICKDFTCADILFSQMVVLKTCNKSSTEDKSSTFIEQLEKRESLLGSRWKISSSEISDIKRPSVILSEMKAYYKSQTPLGELLLKALNNLLILNPTPLEAAKGILLVLDSATKSHIDVEKLNKKRTKILDTLSKQVEKDCNDFESLLAYGSMLHYNALFKIYAARKKTQMETMKWKTESTNPTLNEAGLYSDPNESCAPVAVSTLTFTNQLPLLEELDKSFSYLKAAFTKTVCDDFETYLEISHSNIKLTAQLYGLYHDKEKAEDAWRFLYTLGEKLSHQTMCITGVTNLLKLQVDVDQSWIDNAREIADSLPEKSPLPKFFYISLASYCIKLSKISDAVSHLMKVGSEFRSTTILTYFLLTLGQLLLVPESSSLWKGSPSSAIKAFDQAVRYLYHLLSNDDWEGFIDHCTLEEAFVETLMCLKQYYSSVMMPRLTYYYLNETLAVVQKLALPLRTAQLLVATAWVDVSVHKKDDCDLKLTNLLAILGLKKKNHSTKNSARSPLRERPSPTAVEEFSGRLSPCDDLIIRDLAFSSRSESSNLNGSPNLYKWSEIEVHPLECSCLPCRTPNYICVTLDIIILHAAAYCIRKQFTQALKYFDDGLKYIEHLERKGINQGWLQGRQAMLNYFYCEMLILHKNFGAAIPYARKNVKLAIGMLPTETFEVSIDHLTLQKDNLMFYNLKNRLRNVEKSKPLPKQTLNVPSSSAGNDRTPAKTSVVPSHLLYSTSSSILTRMTASCDRRNMQVRSLQFSSDEENEIVDETLTEKENNFVSPNYSSKQRVRRKQLPSIVSKIPLSVKGSNISVDPSKDKKSKPNAKFKICKDTTSSSKVNPVTVDNTKNDKPKRLIRAVNRK